MTATYNARILELRDEDRASYIITTLAKRPSAFTRWLSYCEENCGDCEECHAAEAAALAELIRPDARVWEVTEGHSPVASLGILRLSRIKPGKEAILDFSFFDNRMSDKVTLIEDLIQNSFEDHPDWEGLQRLVAEVPAHAFLQIRTFSKLGFGGDFKVKFCGLKYKVHAVIPTANEAVGDLALMVREVA